MNPVATTRRLPPAATAPRGGWVQRVALACILVGVVACGEALAQPLPAPALGGSLRWTETRAELRAGAGAGTDTVLEARYPFRNAGNAPVEITAIQSDCDCTVAELAKRRYAPGEAGEVLARFAVGERVGRQEKHVTIHLAGEATPTTLTLVVLIPELLRLRPGFLFWVQGEATTPKTLLVEAGEGVTVKRLSVTSSQAFFAPALRVVEEGRRYELSVTPARTDLTLMAQLPLSGEFEVTAPTVGAGPEATRQTVTKVLTAHAAVKTAAGVPAPVAGSP